MGLGDVWYKTKVYFGLAEDEDWYDDDEDGSRAAHDDLELHHRRAAERASASIASRGRGQVEVEDIFPEDAARPGRRSRLRDGGGPTAVLRPADSVGAADVAKVYLSVPARSTTRSRSPTSSSAATRSSSTCRRSSRPCKAPDRFGSGLTYGLDGSMQRIADKVFLLTPPDVDVSAEDRAPSRAASSTRADASAACLPTER